MNLRQLIYLIATVAMIAVIATLSRLGLSENESVITIENLSPLNRETVDKIIIKDTINQTTITKENLDWKVGNYPVVFDGFEDMWEVISYFPKIMVCNHISLFDPFILTSILTIAPVLLLQYSISRSCINFTLIVVFIRLNWFIGKTLSRYCILFSEITFDIMHSEVFARPAVTPHA